MNYQFAKMLDGTTWAMRPKSFKKMLERAMSATPEDVRAAVAAYGPGQQGPKMYGDVAVIDACGPITYKSSWFSMYFGGSSIEDMQNKLRLALADPAVKTILFRWDSPGGCCEMVPEFTDELFAARGQKPILAASDTMLASAAYWIASQSDTIYATTSSRIGAIGVFTEHDDISGMLEKAGIKITLIAHGAHKVDGNPYEALGEDVKAEIQEDVDAVGDLFDSAVARGRGVSKQMVLDTFGQGDVFSGKEAIKLGLADKVGTFSQVLARLTKTRGGAVSMAARADTVPVLLPSGEAVLNSKQLAAAVAAAVVGKKAKATCEACGKSSCACTAAECPEDCPTCDPDCPCVQPPDDDDDDEAAKAQAAKAAEDDAIAITAVIGTER